MKKVTLLLLTILSISFAGTVIVSAQWKDNMGGNWNNPTSASIGNIINDRLWNRMRAKARARKNGAGPPEKSEPTEAAGGRAAVSTKPVNEESAKFRSTGTQLKTRAIAEELVGTGTPEEKNQMVQLLGGYLTEYEKAARAAGKPNDLALAITAALVFNSSIYNGTPEPAEARIMEIRDALAELMSEGGTTANLGDRQKQELYETMVIFTMLAKAGYEEARKNGDDKSLEIYRQLAGQILRSVSGMAPEQINLSGDGPPTSNSSPNVNQPVAPAVIQAPSGGTPMHAAALVKEFEANEVRANQAYVGKRLRIHGIVNSIDIDNDGKIVLTFKSSISTYANARCFFPKSQSVRVASINANDDATVEGTVRGLGGGYDGAKSFVVLENCIVP